MTKIKPLTEADWLTSAEPYRMLQHLRQHQRISRTPGGARRLRLLAVAFCRRVEHLMDERCRAAVAIAERYADGKARRAELEAAGADAEEVSRAASAQIPILRNSENKDWVPFHRTRLLADLARGATRTYGLVRWVQMAATTAMHVTVYDAGTDWKKIAAAGQPEADAQRELIRDVFGNPFQPAPAVENAWLAWNHGIIDKMARVIYDERAFDRMPILADALEEAGCTDAAILGHCRRGLHTRGCWLIDLMRTTCPRA
jgi:hypothetical protein